MVLFAAILFIVWRFTQRRFSDLDDGGDDIKVRSRSPSPISFPTHPLCSQWPELQPDGQTVAANTSTLNPMGTRRTGGAGIEMDGDGGKEEFGDGGEMSRHTSMYYDQGQGQGSYEQVNVYGNAANPGGAYCAFFPSPSPCPFPPPFPRLLTPPPLSWG